MKKIVSFALCLVLTVCMLAGLTACGGSKATTYTVGICQLVQHEALDAATKGFKQALVDKLGEEAVVFDEQNAAGDNNTCNTIVNSFVSKKVDLIMANATPALQAAYNATETIPILGTSVTEYGVALNIENFNGVVGGNVSGTSDLAPLADQAAMVAELCPDAKTVGLLFCSAEPNSAYQVQVMETELAAKGFTTTRFSFSDSNDVAAVTTAATQSCDVIYIPTDNTAATCSATIGNIVRAAKIPVIAGEAGLCANCGVAALSISYFDLGYKTGEMAADILTGKADISTMEIAYAPATKQYNKTICDELNFTIPDGYTAIAQSE